MFFLFFLCSLLCLCLCSCPSVSQPLSLLHTGICKLIPPVRRSIHTSLSYKLSFSKACFKTEEFGNAGFSFSCGRKHFEKRAQGNFIWIRKYQKYLVYQPSNYDYFSFSDAVFRIASPLEIRLAAENILFRRVKVCIRAKRPIRPELIPVSVA